MQSARCARKLIIVKVRSHFIHLQAGINVHILLAIPQANNAATIDNDIVTVDGNDCMVIVTLVMMKIM